MKSEMKKHKNKHMKNKIEMNRKMKNKIEMNKKKKVINKKIINQKIKYVKLKTGKNKEKAYKEKIYPYRIGEKPGDNETIERAILELRIKARVNPENQTYKPYCEQKIEIEPEIREKGIIIYDNETCEADVFKAKIPTIMRETIFETKIWKPEYKRRVKVELERITRWEETPEELVRAAMLNQTEVYRIVEIIDERG